MKPTTSTILLSSVVAAAVSLAVAFAVVRTPDSRAPARRSADNLSTIQSRGTVRAAYAVGAPLFTIDPNTGAKSGIFYDITTSAASRLDLKVDWVAEVGYGEMIQGLQSGRYDLVGSGVWINSDRAKGADFTIPLYYDAVYAFARAGDRRFNSTLSNLNSPDFVISTMDGELGTTIAKTDFPKARTLQLPQNADFSQLILNVLERKADIVFLAAAPARSYETANPGKIVAVNPANPTRIFPNAIIIPQGQFELRQAFNAALTEMLNSGDVDAILRRYEEHPGSFLRVAKPYQAQ